MILTKQSDKILWAEPLCPCLVASGADMGLCLAISRSIATKAAEFARHNTQYWIGNPQFSY